MPKNKSIKINFIMNVILTMSSMIFPLISFPYVSRILTPVGTGKVSFSYSLISYFLMIAQLGIPTYGIRVCAGVRDDKEKLTRTAHELLGISLIMTFFSYVLFAMALLFVPRLYDDRLLYIVMSLSILLDSLGMEWLYKALENYTYIAIRSVLFKFIALVAMFLFVHDRSDYIIYGAIFIFAASASNFVNFVSAHKYIGVKWLGDYNLKKHFKAVLVFFSLACAATIYTNLDSVMLGFMKTDADVGYYNAAIKVKNVLVSIVTSLGAVLLPRASYYVEHGEMEAFRRIYTKAINFVMIVAVPVFVYGTLFARECVLFLSGDAYTPSIFPMQIIMPTVLFIGMTNILGIQILVPLGKEKEVLYSEIAGAIVDVVLNFILIPKMGAAGAAVGTLAAELVVLVVQYWALKDEVTDALKAISYHKLILATLAAYFAASLVKMSGYGIIPTIIISGIVFFGIYIFVMLLTKEKLMLELFNTVINKISVVSDNVISAIDSRITDGMRKASEMVFLVVMVIYLAFTEFKMTMLELPFPDNSFTLMMFPLLLAVALQWLTHLRKLNKVIIGGMIIMLYGIVYVKNITEFSGYGHMILLALMTAGCIGMQYEKILKVSVVTVVSVLLITFVAASIGAAENLVYYAGGWRLSLRGSLGVWFTTDCASLVLFSIMMIWVAFKKIPNWVELLISAVGLLFIKYYCDSRCSFICTILFMFVVVYRIVEETFIEKKQVLGWIKRVVDLLVLVSAPLGAVVIYVFSVLYGKGNALAHKLDKLIDYRFGYSWDAIDEYGIKPFGTNFDMSGAGMSLVNDTAKYNFLDSSYINILVRYGYLLAFAVLIMWIYVIIKAIKLNDRRMLLVMAVVAVHSFEEQHFAEAIYNPLVAMCLCEFVRNKEKAYRLSDFKKLKEKRGYLAGAALAVLTLLGLPKIFTVFRTVIDVIKAKGSAIMSVSAFALIVLFFAAIILLVFGISLVVQAKIEKTKIGRPGMISIIAGLGCSLIIGATSFAVIRAGKGQYAERLETDKAAIELIMKNKTHNVYVNEYPSVYIDAYKGFSESIWSEDDMARYHRATVLVDKDHDSLCFLNRGYMYAQISDHTGVYTNDVAVINALEDSGYHITGFYSSAKTIDIDEEGALEPTSMFGGKYIMTVGLKLDGNSTDTSGNVGTVNFRAFEADSVVASRNIMLSDFDESGNAVVDITLNCSRGIPELRYEIEPYGENTIKITSCSYKKRPDVDTHNFYNEVYQLVRSEYYDADGNRIAMGSGESACEYEYDKKRNRTVTRYYGIDYKPIIISSGYAEIHREYNSMRYVVKESYYGTDGQLMALGDGHASDSRVVDIKGNILVQKYYDVEENPVMLTNGYAELRREYDDKRRVTREEYRDVNGELIKLTSGYAAVEKDYDDNDNVIAQRYFGNDDKPTMTIWGYAEIRRVYDDLNRVIEESYFNADGNPIITTSGYAEIHREYDAMSRIIAESYFGTDGNPIALTAGQASEQRVYNQNGNLIVQKYFGTDGKPRLMTWGYAEIHKSYNGKNQVIREEYYGTDGKPIELSSGQAAVETEYDDSGTPNVLRYYGIDGNLKMLTSGYAETRRVYNSLRQLVSESYYGIDEQPVALSSGQASDSREYDAAGNMISQKYFDVSGNAVVITSGYAEIHREFNAKKQIVAESYFGADGNPIALGGGQASDTRVLDDRGNCIEQKYFDVDGNPVVITSGFAEIHRVFNDKNQVTHEEYYGTDGELMAVPTGQASIDRENDAVGNALVYKYYDVSGNRVMTTSGYAELHRTYNDKRQVTSESYYGIDGQPIALGSGQASDTRELDERGNCVVQKYYGVSGNLILRTDGFAEIRRVFNAQNKVVNEKYFGLNGEPVLNSSGFTSKDIEYDEKGNYVSEKHYDLDGNPV